LPFKRAYHRTQGGEGIQRVDDKQKQKLHEFIAEWVDEAWGDEYETEADEATRRRNKLAV
jgi:hypothetical protein